MTDLPSGTVTFLFSDIEGSAAHWERNPSVMRTAVDRHFSLLRDAITANGGELFKTVGDAVHSRGQKGRDGRAGVVPRCRDQQLRAGIW